MDADEQLDLQKIRDMINKNAQESREQFKKLVDALVARNCPKVCNCTCDMCKSCNNIVCKCVGCCTK